MAIADDLNKIMPLINADKLRASMEAIYDATEQRIRGNLYTLTDRSDPTGAKRAALDEKLRKFNDEIAKQVIEAVEQSRTVILDNAAKASIRDAIKLTGSDFDNLPSNLGGLIVSPMHPGSRFGNGLKDVIKGKLEPVLENIKAQAPGHPDFDHPGELTGNPRPVMPIVPPPAAPVPAAPSPTAAPLAAAPPDAGMAKVLSYFRGPKGHVIKPNDVVKSPEVIAFLKERFGADVVDDKGKYVGHGKVAQFQKEHGLKEDGGRIGVQVISQAAALKRGEAGVVSDPSKLVYNFAIGGGVFDPKNDKFMKSPEAAKIGAALQDTFADLGIKIVEAKKLYGIKPDGTSRELDANEVKKLKELAALLVNGPKPPDDTTIKAWQEAAKIAGFDVGVDGKFGRQSARAAQNMDMMFAGGVSTPDNIIVASAETGRGGGRPPSAPGATATV